MDSKKVLVRKRKYFPTRYNGFIVDATSGQYFTDGTDKNKPYRVGTLDEKRFFKVMDCTGKCDSKGFLIPYHGELNRDPNMLFYASPLDYARHSKTFISPKKIAEWHQYIDTLFPEGGDIDMNVYNHMKETNSFFTLM